MILIGSMILFLINGNNGNKPAAELHPVHATKRADLISFLYVLEHVDHPGEFLDVIKTNLQLDGLVFIEIPDASVVSFASKDHDAYNSCHLWLFGSAQVTELLKNHGFSVLALQRYITVRGYPSMMILAGHSERYDPYQLH